MADFNYTAPVTIKIENLINEKCNLACDPGNIGVMTLVTDKWVAQNPNATVDYLFKKDCIDGIYTDRFLTYSDLSNSAQLEVLTSLDIEGKIIPAVDEDIILTTKIKYRNSDRLVPAYRVENRKTLKAGDSMTFTASNASEVIFYEKVAKAFEKDGLKVTITEASAVIPEP